MAQGVKGKPRKTVGSGQKAAKTVLSEDSKEHGAKGIAQIAISHHFSSGTGEEERGDWKRSTYFCLSDRNKNNFNPSILASCIRIVWGYGPVKTEPAGGQPLRTDICLFL